METPEIYLQKLTTEIVRHFTEQKPNFSPNALQIIKEMLKETEESISIPKKEYENLKKDEKMLIALQGAGVDNWEGYDFAMEILSEIKD